MADYSYVYSLASDFPGGAINAAKLDDEIKLSSIVTALRGVTVAGDVVTVTFAAQLSAGDKTALDNDATGPSGGLIAAHDNTPSAPQSEVKVINEADVDGAQVVRIKVASDGWAQNDRDIRFTTSDVDSLIDKKLDWSTKLESDWGECTVKLWDASQQEITLEANENTAVMTELIYEPNDGNPANPVAYELRDGYLMVPNGLTAPKSDWKVYAVGATVATTSGVPFFDAFLDNWEPPSAGEYAILGATSPAPKRLDPIAPGATQLRCFILHPAGAQVTFTLRLVTYRQPR